MAKTNEMSLGQIIALFNKGTRTEEVLDRLKQLTGDARALMIQDDGKINAADTIQALAYCRKYSRNPPGGRSVTEIQAEMDSAKDEADPITLEALWKGQTETADWSGVSKENRELAGYAAEIGYLKDSSEKVAWSLTKNLDEPPWPWLRKKWAEVQRAAEAGDLDSATLVARVRARLVARPAPRPAPVKYQTPPVSPPRSAVRPDEPCSATRGLDFGCPGQRGGPCGESGEIGRCGRVIP